MKIKNILPVAAMAVASLGFSSCVGDLDADNINPQQVPTANYDALLNKVYANMVQVRKDLMEVAILTISMKVLLV